MAFAAKLCNVEYCRRNAKTAAGAIEICTALTAQLNINV